MRKIERQMNAAITSGNDWQSGNTMVTHQDGVAFVFLHGNNIAQVGDTFIRLFDGGWQSNTTKSRLNAILAEHGEPGDCVFQKKFEWFVRMNTAQGLTTIPFFSSMRLGWSMHYNMPCLGSCVEYSRPRHTGSFLLYIMIRSFIKKLSWLYKKCIKKWKNNWWKIVC